MLRDNKIIPDISDGTSGSSGSSGTSGIAGTGGTSGTSGTGGVYTTQEKDNIELRTSYEAAVKYNDKTLTYIGGQLTQVNVYDGTTLLFIKVLTYDVQDRLDTVVITRQSDGYTLTKTLSYDLNDLLTSILET